MSGLNTLSKIDGDLKSKKSKQVKQGGGGAKIIKEEEYNFDEILKGLEMPDVTALDFQMPLPDLKNQ